MGRIEGEFRSHTPPAREASPIKKNAMLSDQKFHDQHNYFPSYASSNHYLDRPQGHFPNENGRSQRQAHEEVQRALYYPDASGHRPFSVQSPYDASGYQEPPVQSPYTASDHRSFSVQSPYDASGRQPFSVQSPYDASGYQEPPIQRSYDASGHQGPSHTEGVPLDVPKGKGKETSRYKQALDKLSSQEKKDYYSYQKKNRAYYSTGISEQATTPEREANAKFVRYEYAISRGVETQERQDKRPAISAEQIQQANIMAARAFGGGRNYSWMQSGSMEASGSRKEKESK